MPAKELCLLHANCQGDPLVNLLRASPAFSSRWDIIYIVNYIKSPVSRENLAACILFIYQYLGPEWNELASDTLIEALNPQAKVLCIPNLFFNGYWPLWIHNDVMRFGDRYLDYLVELGLEPAEAVYLYMRDDMVHKYDLDTLVSQSMAKQRQREANSIIEFVDYIDTWWKKRPLFTTINHPQPELTRMIANAILEKLGLPLLPELDHPCFQGLDLSCDYHFELPVHPAVGKHFGLPFVSAERTYPVYGKQMTFQQYSLTYAECRRRIVECRRAGVDFITYLQNIQV